MGAGIVSWYLDSVANSPPPGPSSKVLTSLRFLADPLRWLARWQQAYGPTFHVPTISVDFCIVSRPDDIRELLALPEDATGSYSARIIQAVTGPHSVLVTEGEVHRRQRKQLRAAFRGPGFQRLGQRICRITARRMRALQPGQVFLARNLGLDIGLDTIVEVVYGLVRREHCEHQQRLIKAAIARISPSFLVLSQLQTRLNPTFRKYQDADNAWRQALDELVEDRCASDDLDARDDILSMLLAASADQKISRAELVDQLRTMLLAGYETSGTSLAWALDTVVRDQTVLHEVRAEIDALPLTDDGTPDAHAIMRSPAVDHVCKEVLRLFPVTSEIFRVLHEPWTVGGHDVPGSWTVAASMFLVHRNPDIFPEPDKFLPGRFADRSFGPHEYLPYGGGHRRCVGAALADLELRCALATLLRLGRFACAHATAPRIVRRGPALGPDNDAPMIYLGEGARSTPK